MSSNFSRLKRILSVFTIFLALTSLVAWVILNSPRPEEFASISILNQKMMASDYFPGNTTTVSKNTLLSWNVQIYNHLGSVQLMLVIVRLSNATLSEPNATYNTPGSGPLLANFTRATLNNETWTIPFQWEILDDTVGASAGIQAMQVNNQSVNANLEAVAGKNFRIEIELWTYDQNIQSFLFSFRSDDRVSSVWNQLWFDI